MATPRRTAASSSQVRPGAFVSGRRFFLFFFFFLSSIVKSPFSLRFHSTQSSSMSRWFEVGTSLCVLDDVRRCRTQVLLPVLSSPPQKKTIKKLNKSRAGSQVRRRVYFHRVYFSAGPSGFLCLLWTFTVKTCVFIFIPPPNPPTLPRIFFWPATVFF